MIRLLKFMVFFAISTVIFWGGLDTVYRYSDIPFARSTRGLKYLTVEDIKTLADKYDRVLPYDVSDYLGYTTGHYPVALKYGKTTRITFASEGGRVFYDFSENWRKTFKIKQKGEYVYITPIRRIERKKYITGRFYFKGRDSERSGYKVSFFMPGWKHYDKDVLLGVSVPYYPREFLYAGNKYAFLAISLFSGLLLSLVVFRIRRRASKRAKARAGTDIKLRLKDFTSRIIAQDEAIEQVLEGVVTAAGDPNRGRRPRYLCFLVGPSGVGKTEFAKVFSKESGLPMYVFNMADYTGDTGRDASGAHWRLFGAAPGYRDSEKSGEFISAVRSGDPCVILLDEIEKANKKVLDTFLTAFQEGFVKSNKGNTYPITNVFLFCTSNACQDASPDMDETGLRNLLVREGFKREFIGRFDRVVMFKKLDITAAKKIFLANIRLAFNGEVSYDDKALTVLLERSGFDEYGVRAIERAITSNGLNSLPKKVKKVHIGYSPLDGSNIHNVIIEDDTNYVIEGLKTLPDRLRERIIGQDQAIDAVVRVLQRGAVGAVVNGNRPTGTFLLAGPTGVGKTELAKTVAKIFGKKMLRFDMGEFKNTSTAQRFYGAPPGYAGSERGGQLTQAVLRNPGAVILLDEVEKAAPAIWDTFLSVFDDGVLTDASTGEKVSFKNTIIFMTSNIIVNCGGDNVRERILDSGYFRSEFINRIDEVVCFNRMDERIARTITEAKLRKVLQSVKKKLGREYTVDENLIMRVLEESDYRNFGARNIERTAEKIVGEMVFKEISSN